MAEELNFIRECFNRIDQKLDRLQQQQDDVITRLGAVEKSVLQLQSSMLHLTHRVDGMDARLRRIEDHMQLSDLPPLHPSTDQPNL